MNQKNHTVDKPLTVTEARILLLELANPFSDIVLFDSNGVKFQLCEDDSVYAVSKGNQLLEQLAIDCVNRNRDRYIDNMTVQRQAKLLGITPPFIAKIVLTTLIGSNEHYSYVGSELTGIDEPTEKVFQEQAKIRSLIDSTNPEAILLVNNLITKQIEGAADTVNDFFS
jgi:hypothetical protein